MAQFDSASMGRLKIFIARLFRYGTECGLFSMSQMNFKCRRISSSIRIGRSGLLNRILTLSGTIDSDEFDGIDDLDGQRR